MDLKKCENCVYYNDPLFKVSDCDRCKNNSGFLSWEDFNAEIEADNIPPEEFKPEITKKRYFLIRWLINLILKYLNKHYWVYFGGIVQTSKGKKCSKIHDSLPFWLNWIVREYWVNEISYGGYTGDIYDGCMYYKILPKFYLVYHYEC